MIDLLMLAAASAFSVPADLATKIESLQADMESRHNYDDAYRDRASQIAKMRMMVWSACLGTYRQRYQSLNEPAETIADAAMGSCQEYRTPYVNALSLAFRGLTDIARSHELASDAAAKADSNFRQTIIAAVLEFRTNKAQH